MLLVDGDMSQLKVIDFGLVAEFADPSKPLKLTLTDRIWQTTAERASGHSRYRIVLLVDHVYRARSPQAELHREMRYLVGRCPPIFHALRSIPIPGRK